MKRLLPIFEILNILLSGFLLFGILMNQEAWGGGYMSQMDHLWIGSAGLMVLCTGSYLIKRWWLCTVTAGMGSLICLMIYWFRMNGGIDWSILTIGLIVLLGLFVRYRTLKATSGGKE